SSSRIEFCITEKPNLENTPTTAITSPVTNQEIQRLPLEATNNAMRNTMPAMTSRIGHRVISSSANTTCSAVSIVTGGTEVFTVRSGSVFNETEFSEAPGTLAVASWIASSSIDTETWATGSNWSCNCASV